MCDLQSDAGSYKLKPQCYYSCECSGVLFPDQGPLILLAISGLFMRACASYFYDLARWPCASFNIDTVKEKRSFCFEDFAIY